jgi:predicted nucleic acid-binding protein
LKSDLSAAIRRFKPEKQTFQIKTRPAAELISADAYARQTRAVLIPDTNVYINSFAGLLTPAAKHLIHNGLLFHSSVCLGEIAVGIGNYNPASAGWKKTRTEYAGLVASIPETRIIAPDEQTWIEAGVIAGILARAQGYQPHQRKECLADALIYLSAAKEGIPVLTSNRDEFDIIQQIAKRGMFVHY